MLGLDPDAFPCAVHARHHTPQPRRNHRHHVILESWTKRLELPAGRTVPLCPTGHENIHVAITMALEANSLSAVHRLNLGDRSFALVAEAFRFWVSQGDRRSLLLELARHT